MMHRVLRKDCAERGGCCGRGCGCCLDRKLNFGRTRAVGHCTAECGCCQRARGYEVSEDEKMDFAIRYAVSKDGKKDVKLKELHLKNLELQNTLLKQSLAKESMKDSVMRYEFCEGEFAEVESYMNEADISEEEAEFTDEDTDGNYLGEEVEDSYYHRISQASIWGLVDGNFEDPVDLIDQEPYHSTWNNDACDEWSFTLVCQEEHDSVMTGGL